MNDAATAKVNRSWSDLDDAARANLSSRDLAEFFRYRDNLRSDGHHWSDDAYVILTGFIWDASEDDLDQ